MGYLLTPNQCGSPITYAIGAAMFQLGADGIIYPSARENAAARHTGDTVEHFGFNVVDLRGMERGQSLSNALLVLHVHFKIADHHIAAFGPDAFAPRENSPDSM
jgi:hypothetical protein